MRTVVLLLLLLAGCASPRLTLSIEGEARDIATTELNARRVGKLRSDGRGGLRADPTISPADWSEVSMTPDVWRLVLREAQATTVVAIDRRTRRVQIDTFNAPAN
jgi:hypothetical protein